MLGATARAPGPAERAVAAGASYLGVGPCHATTTKTGLPDPIGPAGVRAVVDAVDVPVIAIGGVTAARVPELRAAGAYGVAVVGAVSAAADPARATAELLEALTCWTGRSPVTAVERPGPAGRGGGRGRGRSGWRSPGGAPRAGCG